LFNTYVEVEVEEDQYQHLQDAKRMGRKSFLNQQGAISIVDVTNPSDRSIDQKEVSIVH